MSILLRRFLTRRLSHPSMSFRYPEDGNMFSTTYKVNMWTWLCTTILFGTIVKTATVLREDTIEIKKLLKELTKK